MISMTATGRIVQRAASALASAENESSLEGLVLASNSQRLLKTDLVRSRLRRETSHNPEFDPNMSLLMSYIISMKWSVCSFSFGTGMGRDQRLWATARDALLTVQGVKSIRKPSCLALFHELFEITGYWSPRPVRLEAPVAPRQFPISTEWRRCFLSLVVRFGLSAFVDNNLKQVKDDRGPRNVPLLSFALGLAQPRGIQIPPQPVWPSMVEVLLRHGTNPNEPCASDLPSTHIL